MYVVTMWNGWLASVNAGWEAPSRHSQRQRWKLEWKSVFPFPSATHCQFSLPPFFLSLGLMANFAMFVQFFLFTFNYLLTIDSRMGNPQLYMYFFPTNFEAIFISVHIKYNMPREIEGEEESKKQFYYRLLEAARLTQTISVCVCVCACVGVCSSTFWHIWSAIHQIETIWMVNGLCACLHSQWLCWNSLHIFFYFFLVVVVP